MNRSAALFFSFLIIFCLFSIKSLAVGDGKSLFQTLRCDSCHNADQGSAGASLKEIAETYPDSEKLMGFFNGTRKPLIESEKAGLMRAQLKKIQGLSDEEKKILADYLMSFK